MFVKYQKGKITGKEEHLAQATTPLCQCGHLKSLHRETAMAGAPSKCSYCVCTHFMEQKEKVS